MTERYGLFALGTQRFAVPLSRLDRVLESQHVWPLPLSVPLFAGVLLDQQRLVPVLVSAPFAQWRGSVDQVVRWVVVTTSSGLLALPADRSCGVHALVTEPLTHESKDASVCVRFHGDCYLLVDIDRCLLSLLRALRSQV